MDITENLKDLITANELEEKKILSKPTQWRERKAGRLAFYHIGNKVFYSPEHIENFFKSREKNAGKTEK